MAWPTPVPGLVIRYAYLWQREQAAGREEGEKDHPCAIIVALAGEEVGRPRVIVLPITHSPPEPSTNGIEVPPATKRRLGLDEERSWVITTEANSFLWPGPDLRPIPGQGPGSTAYGVLPPDVFLAVRDRFLAAIHARRVASVPRTE